MADRRLWLVSGDGLNHIGSNDDGCGTRGCTRGVCDCGVSGAAEWRGPTGHGRGGGHFEYRHATQWGRAQCGSGVADGWQADGIGIN